MLLTVILRMNGTMIGILLVSFLIIGIAVAVGMKKRKELLSEGVIVDRPYNFYDIAEIFTLGPVAFQAVVNVMMRQDYSRMEVTATPDPQNNRIIFQQGRWVAVLAYMGETAPQEQGGKSVYRFWFTTYNTYRSSVEKAVEMNMLMTTVEKALLGFDPNTQVATEMVTRTSKTKFF